MMWRCYGLQVNIFDREKLRTVNRLMNQVYTRKCRISDYYRDLKGLGKYFDDPAELKNYKNKLYNLERSGRKYTCVGTAGSDNMFELESLGIVEYGHGFTLIIDFSLCLDYVLHRAYGCSINSIRSIDGYDEISNAILNKNFSNLDIKITFSLLYNSSKEIRTEVSLLRRMVEETKEIGTSIDSQVSWIMYQFYSRILSVLSSVKFYTAVEIASDTFLNGGRKGIIRSQNFSSVIVTVGRRYAEPVTLHSLEGGFDDYSLVVRSYAPYEYLGEVLRRSEFNRGI